MNKFKRGYIAVTSAIIISFLVLLITGVLSLALYFSRFNVFNSQAKEQSLSLAEGCGDQALLKLAENSGYTGNETLAVVGSSTCIVGPFSVNGNQESFKVFGSFQGSSSTVQIVIKQVSSTIQLVSWAEVPQ